MKTLFLITLLGLGMSLVAGQKRMVCYFESWAVYRENVGKFDVEDIDPNLCTHIIYSFIGLGDDNRVNVLDPWNDLEDDGGNGAMKRFTGLKASNPNLKALLAIGGWSEGSEKYSNMALTAATRRTFIDSVVAFLESQGFDGLDLDWEYPANREGSRPEDKQNFVLLINELKAAFEPRGWLLTAAVGAGLGTIQSAYDIPGISAGLDFINVMTYDYHGDWEQLTGHHSPLGTNPSLDLGDNVYLNSNFSISYFIENGTPPAKLNLGIGSYGRGWVLNNAAENGLYAPANAPIPPGPYLGSSGYWGYFEICETMNNQQGQWTVVTDPMYQTPYAYNGRNWIGYESPSSAANKAAYINSMGLGGGFMWAIDTDDFRGACGEGTFPLVKSLKGTMN